MAFCHGFDCVVVLTHRPEGDVRILQTWECTMNVSEG